MLYLAKQYTKNLIKREFLLLAEEKSLKNITIAELADRCEINRNTFYYHYEDIYMLIKEILNDELAKIDEEFNYTNSWEDSLLQAVSFILNNIGIFYNLLIRKNTEDANTFHMNCTGVFLFLLWYNLLVVGYLLNGGVLFEKENL